jgi:hypothetical protein
MLGYRRVTNNVVSTQINISDASINQLANRLDASINQLTNFDINITQIANILDASINQLTNFDIPITQIVNILDASINQLANVVDASINQLAYVVDASINQLANFDITLSNIIDASINQLANVVDASINQLANFDITLSNIIDASINQLANVVDASINQLANVVDASINQLANVVDASINQLANVVDASINQLANVVDASINQLANFDITLSNIIDASINQLANVVDASINQLANVVDASINQLANVVDASINQLANVVDASINQLANVVDASINQLANVVDASINNLSYSLYVNDISQTFYEIVTQQPYKFKKNDISINSSSIILRWNYDSIIAKHSNNNIAKLSNVLNYTQNLPFIDKIYIDICQNNTWINVDIISISGDYNINNFKHYIFQRNNNNQYINNNMSFSMRVYGENYSNNYPTIESRSLIFYDLSFLNANSPNIPLFIESNVPYVSNSNVNNITLTYFNSFSDSLDFNSVAYLTNYIIDYSLNASLASTSLASTSFASTSFATSISGNFSNIINSSSNFYITLTNLMSGSNYNHKVKVRNNFSNVYSDYTTLSGSKYTLLPNDNAIGTSINMSIKAQCYKFISSSNLDNSSILYFNIANTGHSFLFDNSSIQAFQITHPYFINQQLETYGYGKFIDNCANLVTINLTVNNVVKHTINYGGFNTNTDTININPYIYTKIDTSYVFILNNNNSIEDIYSHPNNIGFRLKGYLLLKDEITNTNIINYIGDPSTNPYIMNFNYIRSASVGNSYSIYNTYYIYIDELLGNPVISNNNNIIVIQDVVYNMGVASIKYSKLLLERAYSNINSIYKYIVHNRIIADFLSTNTILTSFSGENIILAQSDICANGMYNYDLCYNFAYHQQVKNNYSFNLLEKVYNLNGYTSSNISLTSKPYCDYNSFDRYNNVIISSKLDLTALHIYEISNIELLGSDLSNIQLKHYNNHTNNILPCSLLYLNSCFNNEFGLYPNSSDFSYNNNTNLDISYNTHGNTSYNLYGTMLNNNQGYKWIVFEILKNNDISNSYLFNGISYNIITTTDGNNIKYLPLKIMLKDNNLFLHSIVDRIFDITDTSALMFGHATTITYNKRYFNIKQNFNGLGGIWTQSSNSSNITYNSTANSKIFGSNVYNEGIYCPINTLNDDLTIYIGLKELIV